MDKVFYIQESSDILYQWFYFTTQLEQEHINYINHTFSIQEINNTISGRYIYNVDDIVVVDDIINIKKTYDIIQEILILSSEIPLFIEYLQSIGYKNMTYR